MSSRTRFGTATLGLVLLLSSPANAQPPPDPQQQQAPAEAATPPDPVAAPPATPTTPADPVNERVRSLREAASLLDKAGAARRRGSRNFAEQLFSSAELIVGTDVLSELAHLFREGAPPRVSTPLHPVAATSAPQPPTVGSSDDDEPEEKPLRGSLQGTLSLGGDNKAGDAISVVTLEPATGKARRRKPQARVIEQRNRQFAPHVLVVPLGSTVTFPNFDGIYHNVFSRSDARSFDLGLYKSGQARDVTFDKEGVVRLACNIHANMSAFVVVVAAPYYAVSDRTGRFSFKSLQPGRYRLRAWNELTAQPLDREIEIKPGKNTVRLALQAAAAASGLGTDKFGAPRGQKP